jgi:hypothetical protein
MYWRTGKIQSSECVVWNRPPYWGMAGGSIRHPVLRSPPWRPSSLSHDDQPLHRLTLRLWWVVILLSGATDCALQLCDINALTSALNQTGNCMMYGCGARRETVRRPFEIGIVTTGKHVRHDPKYITNLCNNICYIWQKTEEPFQRFVNVRSAEKEFWRDVTSPHIVGAKHLVIYRHSKCEKPEVIHGKLESTLGRSNPPYPMVTNWCKNRKRTFDIPSSTRRPGRPLNCDFDDITFSALNGFPFHSFRSPSRMPNRQHFNATKNLFHW